MSDLIICPICGFKTENLCMPHIKTHGYTNAKSFKKEYDIPYLKSDRLRKVQSDLMLQNNPTKGKKRSDIEITKMSQNRIGKGNGNTGKYERTSDIREKISKGVIEAYCRGDFDKVKPGNGSFVFAKKANRTIYTRSSWEKRILYILECSNEVESFDYEILVIPYLFENATHNYIPDFLVKGTYGVNEIWEIKRDDLIDNKDPKTMAKLAALDQYCIKHGFNSRVLKLKDIVGLEKIIRRQS